jgi:AAA family ATP:ADP antiporter
LSIYGSSVNIVSLFCLLLGISNVTRFLGVGVALAAMPIIVGVALFSFLTIDSLAFLFTLMVGSKAINYALNGPALKQLYIPTTTDVRFKAQAWIETFGSRSSKEAGSVFNMLLKPLQNAFGEIAGKAHYLILSGAIGFPLLALWFITAFYLGKRFRKAIHEKKVVC